MYCDIRFNLRLLKRTLASLCLVMLCGCAAERSGIGVAVTPCCEMAGIQDGECEQSDSSVYDTFLVVAEDIPAFLGPLMVSNFSVALSHHGLAPVTRDPDLVVTLRYVQNNLKRHRERDDFEEKISTGDSERFAARIAIEFREADTKTLVWSGYIERIHDVGPGEWMHTGRASVAIYDSFIEVLKDYRR